MLRRLLPTEAEKRVNEALKAWEEMERGMMVLTQPCDCGAQIRHFNGGNYHEIIALAKDRGVWICRYSTCELKPIPPWRESSEEEARSIIIDRVSDGYYWKVKVKTDE